MRKELMTAIIIITLLGGVIVSIPTKANKNTPSQMNVEWELYYPSGSHPNNAYTLNSVITIKDGTGTPTGFIALIFNYTGLTYTGSLVLIKINLDGTIVSGWPKEILPEGSTILNGYCIQQTDDDGDGIQDDGFIITGEHRDNLWNRCLFLLKINQNGDIIWLRDYSGYSYSVGYAMVQYYNYTQRIYDGYLATGWAQLYGDTGESPLLIKTDLFGTKLWDRIYERNGQLNDGTSIQETKDGGCVISKLLGKCYGELYNSGLVKCDKNGIGQRRWIYGDGVPTMTSFATSVKITNDGDYIMTGWMAYQNNSGGGWLIKQYANGNPALIIKYMDHSRYFSMDLYQSGYVLCGVKSNMIFIAETDLNGNILQTLSLCNSYCGKSIQTVNNDGYIIGGDNGYDSYIVKIGNN
jgi:hypothetical protein